MGYKSTNIYRIWIPHKKKVISTRDVIFNEDKFWNKKPLQLSFDNPQKLDKVIKVIKIPHAEDQEDIQLAEDTIDFLDAITH